MAQDAPKPIHASAVAFDGRGILLLGPSGSGKSTLALALMALGAGLIADDQTLLSRVDSQIILACPPTLSGRIEARFVGLLNAPAHPPAPLHLVVDLAQTEQHRLPPHRSWSHLGLTVPLLHNVAHGSFPSALRQYLLYGRSDQIG